MVKLLLLNKHVLILLRYLVTGCLGLSVDFTITFFLRELLDANQYFASAVGFVFGGILTFLLHINWTFKQKNNKLSRFGIYIITSAIGLMLNLLITISANNLTLHFYASKSIAVIMVFIWNFGVNRIITFRSNTLLRRADTLSANRN